MHTGKAGKHAYADDHTYTYMHTYYLWSCKRTFIQFTNVPTNIQQLMYSITYKDTCHGTKLDEL